MLQGPSRVRLRGSIHSTSEDILKVCVVCLMADFDTVVTAYLFMFSCTYCIVVGCVHLPKDILFFSYNYKVPEML